MYRELLSEFEQLASSVSIGELEVIACSILESMEKDAGVEYGFTAYKDEDDKYLNMMKRLTEIEKDEDYYIKPPSKEEHFRLYDELSEKGKPDYVIYSNKHNLDLADRRNWDKILNNKALAYMQYNYIEPFDEVLNKSKGLKTHVTDAYSGEALSPVTDSRGAADIRTRLKGDIKKMEETAVETDLKQQDIAKAIEGIQGELDKAKVYQIFKKQRARKALEEKKKKLGRIEANKADISHSTETLKKWDEALDTSMSQGDNLYHWEWY